MWLIIISALVTLVSFGYLYLTWNFNYWKDRGVPGPRPKPFLGTFSSTFTQKEHPIDENNRIYRWIAVCLDSPLISKMLINHFFQRVQKCSALHRRIFIPQPTAIRFIANVGQRYFGQISSTFQSQWNGRNDRSEGGSSACKKSVLSRWRRMASEARANLTGVHKFQGKASVISSDELRLRHTKQSFLRNYLSCHLQCMLHAV